MDTCTRATAYDDAWPCNVYEFQGTDLYLMALDVAGPSHIVMMCWFKGLCVTMYFSKYSRSIMAWLKLHFQVVWLFYEIDRDGQRIG